MDVQLEPSQKANASRINLLDLGLSFGSKSTGKQSLSLEASQFSPLRANEINLASYAATP